MTPKIFFRIKKITIPKVGLVNHGISIMIAHDQCDRRNSIPMQYGTLKEGKLFLLYEDKQIAVTGEYEYAKK